MNKQNSMSWFPFYVNDFLGSLDVQLMNSAQVGSYCLLMAWQWNSPGCKLPSSPASVSQLGRLNIDAPENEIVRKKFEQADGWYNAKLLEVWTQQSKKYAKMSEGGKKGGLKAPLNGSSKGGSKGGGKQPEPEPDNNNRAKKFIPPTPEEVEEYSMSIGYPMQGQAWCDAYAQKDWRVGKNKMKDWRCAVRNWKAQKWKPSVVSNDRKGTVNGAVI